MDSDWTQTFTEPSWDPSGLIIMIFIDCLNLMDGQPLGIQVLDLESYLLKFQIQIRLFVGFILLIPSI